MSWAPGWYGWDVDSEDAAAWGPFTTSDEARGHPDVYAPDDAEVRVFYVSVSDTPRHRDWPNDTRQRAIWVDGPDSEAARARTPDQLVQRLADVELHAAMACEQQPCGECSGCALAERVYGGGSVD